MQAKVEIGDAKNLYEYWHDMLYRSVIDENITISFCEQAGNKLVTKGTYLNLIFCISLKIKDNIKFLK